MSSKNFILALFTAIAVGLPGLVRAEFPAPINSTDDFRHFLSRIPAPRGLIVDRTGKTLAVSKSGKRIALRLLTVEAGSGERELTEAVDDLVSALSLICPSVETPDPELVTRHFKNRPYIPFPISRVLPGTEAAALAGLDVNGAEAIEVQDVITREYPAGVTTSHLVGFVGETMPDQHSPYGKEEYRWPPFEGRRGLEESFDKELRGTDGLLSLLYDDKGREVNREILVAPVPGKTLVATVDLGMQELAMRELEKSGHYGAFVAVDSESGDILALASYPGFDPNEFVPNISSKRYLELSQAMSAPFFDRAVSGSYPPGSIFKPIVALAGLGSGAISPDTQFSGPPSIYVGDHEFKNWNNYHEGSLDVRFALLRSCNTWFYQAAIQMRSGPILDAASRFRLGTAPAIPLKGVSSGFIPPEIPSDGIMANVSIGQGQVQVSPLQMAIAMTGFANRDRVVQPRLVLQTQDPMTGDLEETFPAAWTPLRYSESAVNAVRDGMWGVVNHALGTGGSAALSKPHVFGKTGTAQWFHEGNERRLGWFAGFADAKDPKIAFAMVAEGAIGETMSGGRNVAPFAGNFLREVYEEPERYLVSVPDEILTPEPRLESPPPLGGSYYQQAQTRRDGYDPLVAAARAAMARPDPQPSRMMRGYFFRRFRGSN